MDNGELNGKKVSERLLAAKHYAELGYGILFIPLGEKRPNTRNWGKGTMINANVIDAVYAVTGSDGNIGLKLGNDTKGRLKVIDLECDSPQAQQDYLDLFGGNPPVTQSYTGKRGRHYLYQWQDGLPPKTAYHLHNDKERLEVRIGNNGAAQSVLPPSLHPEGITYKWVEGLSPDDAPLAALPDDVVAKLWEGYIHEKEPAKVFDGELPHVDCPVTSRVAQAKTYLDGVPSTQAGYGTT